MPHPSQLPFWPSLTAGTSARAAARVRAARKARARATTEATESPAERAVRDRLQQKMGARVTLKHDGGKGSFTVSFSTYEELDEIMRRIRA